VFDLVLSLDVDLVLLEGEFPRFLGAKVEVLGVGGLGPVEPGAWVVRWNLVCLLVVIIIIYFCGVLLFSDFYGVFFIIFDERICLIVWSVYSYRLFLFSYLSGNVFAVEFPTEWPF